MNLKIDTTYYQNQSALPTFLKSISKVIIERILISIKKSPFFGIMIHETTDMTNMKKLIVYRVKYQLSLRLN